MRLLFILDRLNLGGAERHTLNLAAALAARGHDVRVAVLFSGGSRAFPIGEFPHPPQLLGAQRLTSLGLVGQVSAVVDDVRPDFVIAINQTALVAARLALRGRPANRLGCIFHTTDIRGTAGWIKAQIFKRFVAGADLLIFVSRLQAAHWVARGGRARRVEAIPNAIELARFAPPLPEARATMRAQLGLRDEEIVVTLLGRLAPEKNHAWLMEVLARLRVERLDLAGRLRLLFIGEGPEEARLRALSSAQGIEKEVIFAGSHRDVAPLLAAADIGILVSNAVETFSLAALELMAVGLPMVMTDIGGAREIILPGETGFLLRPGDEAALRAALIALTDDTLRARMGADGRARVLRHFTYDRMVDCYEAAVEGRSLPEEEAVTWAV